MLLYLGSPHVLPWDKIQEWRKVTSKLIFHTFVCTGCIAYYTYEYTATFIIRNKSLNNRRKIYAFNILSITFV
jgi:hypothetical protein